MIALVGDAGPDEGNIFESLLEGWKHGLRNRYRRLQPPEPRCRSPRASGQIQIHVPQFRLGRGDRK
jgi:hypothetical protein